MASFADPRIVGGDQDPRIAVATPGCVARFTPRRAGRGLVPGSTNTFINRVVVNSASGDARHTARIPPLWIEESEDAFLAFVSANPTGPNWFALSTSSSDSNRGAAAGPNVTADARANWGMAVFNRDGQSSFATFADAYAARQPGLTAEVDPMQYTGQWSTITPAEWTNDQGWTFVIVDRTHPNVNWARLEFLSTAAGAGFTGGHDRFLLAGTLGQRYLVVHSGTPPTAANRTTGGGYRDKPMTGPTDWELSSQEAIRVIQNVNEIDFGMATNVWTRSTHLALWTGPAATGRLLWADPILQFTVRSGGEPKIAARALKIGLPNLV